MVIDLVAAGVYVPAALANVLASAAFAHRSRTPRTSHARQGLVPTIRLRMGNTFARFFCRRLCFHTSIA